MWMDQAAREALRAAVLAVEQANLRLDEARRSARKAVEHRRTMLDKRDDLIRTIYKRELDADGPSPGVPTRWRPFPSQIAEATGLNRTSISRIVHPQARGGR